MLYISFEIHTIKMSRDPQYNSLGVDLRLVQRVKELSFSVSSLQSTHHTWLLCGADTPCVTSVCAGSTSEELTSGFFSSSPERNSPTTSLAISSANSLVNFSFFTSCQFITRSTSNSKRDGSTSIPTVLCSPGSNFKPRSDFFKLVFPALFWPISMTRPRYTRTLPFLRARWKACSASIPRAWISGGTGEWNENKYYEP